MWTSLVSLPYRIGIIACLIAATFCTGWLKGVQYEKGKWQAADAMHARQDAEQRTNAAEHARQQEQLLRATLDAQAAERSKENADHEKQLEDLRARARAGTERLYCPGAALRTDPTPADSAAAGRSEPEARPGEVVPGTADALFRIAAGIRRGVQERNALIDTYNEARATCNAP